MATQRWEVSSSEAEEEESEIELCEGGVEEEDEEDQGGRSGEVEAAMPEEAAGRPARFSSGPKFKCPPDFAPCPGQASHHHRLTPGKVNEPQSELWLIKAPADFNPRSFSGRKVPLVGFQTLKSKTCGDKLYNVFGTSGGAGGVCLVLPPETAGRAESCPEFAGCITIAESWEDAGTGGGEPRSIPASPAPSIPPGLKLRFQPFGAAPPGWSPPKRQRAPSGATTPELGGVGEPGAKRRKRAKGKTAGGGDDPDHEAADREAPRKKKKRSKEQKEAAFEHSDTGTPEPEHRKREKMRRKDESSEIPQTVPREGDLSHKKKKKKDKH